MAKGKTGVTLNWGGLDRALVNAACGFADRRSLLRAVGETLRSSAMDRFEEGAGPDGTPWETSERAREDGGQTLVNTGRLRNSIGYAVTDDVVLWGSKIKAGTNLQYAAIHQKGGQTGRNHAVTMPARPYLGVSDDDIDDIRALVAGHMLKMFGG